MVFSVYLGRPLVLIMFRALFSSMDARITFPVAPAKIGIVVPLGEVIFNSFLDSTMSRIVICWPFKTPRKTDSSVFSINSSMTGRATSARSIWE